MVGSKLHRYNQGRMTVVENVIHTTTSYLTTVGSAWWYPFSNCCDMCFLVVVNTTHSCGSIKRHEIMSLPSLIRVVDHAIIEVDPFSYQGVLPLEGNKRIYNKHYRCVIPLHEFHISLICQSIPFNDFEMGVLNHLTIAPQ